MAHANMPNLLQNILRGIPEPDSARGTRTLGPVQQQGGSRTSLPGSFVTKWRLTHQTTRSLANLDHNDEVIAPQRNLSFCGAGATQWGTVGVGGVGITSSLVGAGATAPDPLPRPTLLKTRNQTQQTLRNFILGGYKR